MKKKRMSCGVMATCWGAIAALWSFHPVLADATPKPTYRTISITMMGQSSIDAAAILATDPWSGKVTNWFPVYALRRALKSAGIMTVWAKDTLNVKLTPTNWAVRVSTANPAGEPPFGDTRFSLGGNAHSMVQAPLLVTNDSATGTNTAYVPVYYASTFMRRQLLMGAVWTGTAWILSPEPLITQTKYIDSKAAQQVIQRDLQGYLSFGPDSQREDLGLGITAKWEGALSHAGLRWHEGNWTVQVLWDGSEEGGKQLAERVVAYLHTHMMPPPKNAGAIVIAGIDPMSTKLQTEVTIAWQEGHVVNQLLTLEPPIQALQTVIDHG